MKLTPTTIVLLVLGLAVGIAAGIGGYTFIYAEGGSYMTNDPMACRNCHVMQEQYDGWTRSSHHNVAVCNDCHAPHDFVGKYSTKAINGWNHSYAFTTGEFHEPIMITERNRAITEAACRDCHGQVVEAIDAVPAGHSGAWKSLDCIRCHQNVGHLH